jgi:Flp pilus assembly protein TadG
VAQRVAISKLIRDDRGAAIVELAAVAAPFIALLLIILEIALAYLAQEALETAAEAAGRSIITGQTQAADTASSATGMTPVQLQERFRQNACATLPRFLSCANLMVDVQSQSTFSEISASAPTLTFNASGNVTNSWNYNTGGAGSIVIVRLMYLWPVPPGPLGLNLSNVGNHKRLLMAASVAKSEAFS